MTDDLTRQEDPADIMDEAIKDRTVTLIAAISIVAVGLLGLWVIGDALLSSGLPWGTQGTSASMPAKTVLKTEAPLLPAQSTALPPSSSEPSKPMTTDVSDPAGINPTTEVQAPQVAAVVAPSASAATEVYVSEPLTAVKKRAKEPLFGVQLGVFNTVSNAEKLRQKMQAQGVPVVVEARVHVGPFATRAQADEARAKLKALGIEESALVILK